MYRHTQDARLQVAERHVNDPEQPDRELVRAIELPQAVPQPLATIGALPDELLAKHPVDDVREHRTAPLVVRLADRPVLSRNAQDGGGASLGRATETVPPRKRRGHRRARYQLDINGCDLQGGISSYE